MTLSIHYTTTSYAPTVLLHSQLNLQLRSTTSSQKDTGLCINLNIDGTPISGFIHTADADRVSRRSSQLRLRHVRVLKGLQRNRIGACHIVPCQWPHARDSSENPPCGFGFLGSTQEFKYFLGIGGPPGSMVRSSTSQRVSAKLLIQ